MRRISTDCTSQKQIFEIEFDLRLYTRLKVWPDVRSWMICSERNPVTTYCHQSIMDPNVMQSIWASTACTIAVRSDFPRTNVISSWKWWSKSLWDNQVINTHNSQEMVGSTQNQTWLDAWPDLSENETYDKIRRERVYFHNESKEQREDRKWIFPR